MIPLLVGTEDAEIVGERIAALLAVFDAIALLGSGDVVLNNGVARGAVYALTLWASARNVEIEVFEHEPRVLVSDDGHEMPVPAATFRRVVLSIRSSITVLEMHS